MFVAYTSLLDKRNPMHLPKPVTFVCQEHSQSALIGLIGRYQKMINRMNDTDFVFQLLTISDVGQGLPIRDLQVLGAVILSQEIITDLRTAPKREGFLIQLHPLDISLEDSEEVKDDIFSGLKDYYYMLPAMTEMKSFSEIALNPAVVNLHKQGIFYLTVNVDGDLIWVMLDRKSTTFVTYERGSMPATHDAWIHLHVPTKTYSLRAEAPPQDIANQESESQ